MTCGFHDPNLTLDFRSNRIHSRGDFILGIVCILPSTRVQPKTGYKSTLPSTRVQLKTGYKSKSILPSTRARLKTGYKSILASTRFQLKTGNKIILPSTRVHPKTGYKEHGYDSCSSSRGLRSGGGLKSTNKPTAAKEFFVRQS